MKKMFTIIGMALAFMIGIMVAFVGLGHEINVNPTYNEIAKHHIVEVGSVSEEDIDDVEIEFTSTDRDHMSFKVYDEDGKLISNTLKLDASNYWIIVE